MSDLKKFFANEKVSASAGSGKTFSLTSRFIALACIQENNGLPDPFSIIALTFTKKAAGEFLTKILTRLADGAESEKGAEALAKSIEKLIPENATKPNQQTFKKVLSACAKNLHKLRLSTIDSFFSTIVRQNASALKIFSPVEIIETNSFEGQAFVLDSISKMIAENSLTDKEIKAFAHLVKKASFGKEQKNLQTTITNLVALAHECYQKNPDVNIWGNAKLSDIKIPNVEWNDATYQELLKGVQAEFEGREEFASVFNFLKESDSTKLGDSSATTIGRILEAKRNGTLKTMTSIPYKKEVYTFVCAKEIDKMLDMLFVAHFKIFCEASHAVGKIAELYENVYDKNVRSNGKISFTDLPFILSAPDRKTEKELIEYKLDAKINHWLFDEFQDTSIKQWEVLRNLVEEAILEYEKSFYYVGDVKQSIYSWRGATPKLFNGIFNYYNTNKTLIQPSAPLVVSWRSGKYVIDAVNKIFGKENQLAKIFSQEAVDMFSADYEQHISAEEDSSTNKKRQPSYAEIRMYQPARSNADDALNVANEILNILKDVRPTERGISCAVLVSKNEEVNVIVETLKENGFNATGDLSVNISKNRPVISLFTAILKRLAHPQNTASDAYCEIASISKFTDDFSDNFIQSALATIYTKGYECFAKEYEKFMRANFADCANVDFKWLKESCAKLDNQEFSSPDNAAEFILSQEVKTSTNVGVIQVMTIHKSKGLSFEITILPIKYKSQTRKAITEISKAVFLPIPSTLANINKTLFEVSEKAKISEDFESICKFYVAATRPERALYFVVPYPSKSSIKAANSDTISLSQYLLQCFSPDLANTSKHKDAKKIIEYYIKTKKVLSIGDKNWFENISKKLTVANETSTPMAIENAIEVLDPETQSPSKTNKHNPENEKFADFGTNVHKIFESLKTERDLENFAKNNLKSVEEQVKNSISKLLENVEFKKFFASNSVFQANEFQFCTQDDEKIITGIMDRIVLQKENDKTVAFVIDYKPSTSNVDKYKNQLEMYRNATTKIFNIAIEDVKTFIVGYLDGEVVEV